MRVAHVAYRSSHASMAGAGVTDEDVLSCACLVCVSGLLPLPPSAARQPAGVAAHAHSQKQTAAGRQPHTSRPTTQQQTTSLSMHSPLTMLPRPLSRVLPRDAASSSSFSSLLRLRPFKSNQRQTRTITTNAYHAHLLQPLPSLAPHPINLNSPRLVSSSGAAAIVVRRFSCCSEPPELLESDLRLPMHAVLQRLDQLDDQCMALQTRLSSDLAVSSVMDKREAHERFDAVQQIRHRVDYIRALQQATINIQAIEEAKKTAQARQQEEQAAVDETDSSSAEKSDSEKSDGAASAEPQDRGEASLGASITDNPSNGDGEKDLRGSRLASLGATPPPPADLREIELPDMIWY
jgi:hypothetical protein